MGILDRLAYKTTTHIPTSWKDSLVEPHPNELPKLPQPTPVLALPTSERMDAVSDHALSGKGEEDVESSAPPPKKKRYISIFFWYTRLKISTRVNKKQPQGNNRYGRKGILACRN